MRIRHGVAALAVVLLGCADNPTAPTTTAATASPQPLAAKRGARPKVHLIYLVPADVEVRRDHVQNLRDAALNLQAWFATALGTGETFILANPIVEIYQTEHDASWYRTNPAGDNQAFWFWFNATADGFAATGGQFYDTDDIWLFYIDAAPGCGQATGGAASVALLPANDLRGLAGEPTINTCTGAIEQGWGPCRWVGGLGHELGHALGLPHPAECESRSPECPTFTLMWLGYTSYPHTGFTTDDRALLAQSPFITETRLAGKAPICQSIGESALTSAGAPAFALTQRVGASGAGAPGTCAYSTLLAASR